MTTPIVAFSHLRWDSVFQRPHQLLSRFAALRPVLFIEEPLRATETKWESFSRGQVQVCRAHIPDSRGWASPAFLEMLADYLNENGLTSPGFWLYTPMAMPVVEHVEHAVLVYDCMDELTLFLNAPPELATLEAELLERADVVFTGGPSLYRAKRSRHRTVFCLPSSVDAAHFGQARHPLPEPADQASIPHPRLGFFGVIDERLDVPVLDHLARHNPTWQIVMVGPVVKIDPAVLPRHPNLHYLGQKPYAELPAYLAGWDVCLLPFARNDATKFISPTKTLEYMAAEKPIVSTPIPDVIELYGDAVDFGGTAAEFTGACRRALAVGSSEWNLRLTRMRELLAKTSWDATVTEMNYVLKQMFGPAAIESAAAERH